MVKVYNKALSANNVKIILVAKSMSYTRNNLILKILERTTFQIYK